jgi:amidohydrolase
MKKLSVLICALITFNGLAQTNSKLNDKFERQAKELEPKIIEWRRYFHQNPELSNREVKTGAKIAEY